MNQLDYSWSGREKGDGYVWHKSVTFYAFSGNAIIELAGYLTECSELFDGKCHLESFYIQFYYKFSVKHHKSMFLLKSTTAIAIHPQALLLPVFPRIGLTT